MTVHRYTFFWLFSCFIFFFSVSLAGAGEGKISSATIFNKEELQGIFTEIISRNSPSHVEEIQISDFSSKPQSLTLPRGKVTYQLERGFNLDSPGKKFISTAISVDGKECGLIRMHGTVHFWAPVVVISQNMSRHKTIEKQDITTHFRDISMLGDGLVTRPELAIGKKLKKSSRPGTVLYSHMLKIPPLVQRGDLVTIMARSGSLQVSAPGEVKNAGAQGDIVQVKNLTSRRLIHARVVDQGLVEVEL